MKEYNIRELVQISLNLLTIFALMLLNLELDNINQNILILMLLNLQLDTLHGLVQKGEAMFTILCCCVFKNLNNVVLSVDTVSMTWSLMVLLVFTLSIQICMFRMSISLLLCGSVFVSRIRRKKNQIKFGGHFAHKCKTSGRYLQNVMLINGRI